MAVVVGRLDVGAIPASFRKVKLLTARGRRPDGNRPDPRQLTTRRGPGSAYLR